MITEERIEELRHDLETVIDIRRKDIREMAEKIRADMGDKDEYPIEVVEKATAEWLEDFIDDIFDDVVWYAWGNSSSTHAPDFNKFLYRAKEQLTKS